MCGIAGFIDYTDDLTKQSPYWESILTHMHQCLAHRGGDQFGTYLKKHIGFSHARLSIRDVEGGTQPIVRHLGSREYAIIYNGEIYNTTELILDLKKAGFTFHTTSDTEVILYCFIHYGMDFVTKLNGIYAFAIWDESKQDLFLYRDRAGVKPLFYAYQQKKIIFGSEPKALFCHPNLSPKLSFEGLQEVLAIGPARTMGNGIFDGINEVLPGHYLRFTPQGYYDYVYWDLPAIPHEDPYQDTVEKVSFLVKDSIQRQMVSDVPVCTFLSGGIDSSIVTAHASNYLQEKGEVLNTFSFDFTGNDKYFVSNSFQPEQDRPYVDIMLKYYPTRHTYLECDENQLFDCLFPAVDAKDLPGMTDVDASLLYFCSEVKKHNKVTLTGECADEIFGGYPWFYREDLLEKDGFPWSWDMQARELLLSQEWKNRLDLSSFSYDKYQTSCGKTPLLSGETPKEKRRREIAYLNIKWFMQTLLDRMDRTSMYSGLEARVPFADHRIMEYVFNVPWEMKYQNGVEKALLRDATKDLLPPKLFSRKKSPYPKTYHPGYEKLLRIKMEEILENPTSPILPLLDKEKTKQYMLSPKEYGRPWFGQLMAGPQLLAYYIQLNYWMKKYHLSL